MLPMSKERAQGTARRMTGCDCLQLGGCLKCTPTGPRRSAMQVKYRVMGKIRDNDTLLFSADYESMAEDFCWEHMGIASELRIERVWVPK